MTVMSEHGIQFDNLVILYSQESPLPAARVLHLLVYAGVRDVRLMDGGMKKWKQMKLEASIESFVRFKPDSSYGTLMYTRKHKYLVSMDHVKFKLAFEPQTMQLVSIRTEDEYKGKTSGYSYIDKAGDIPTSLYGHAGINGDRNDMSFYLNPLDANCFEDWSIVKQIWIDQGISVDSPKLQTIFYCGTGWRASLAWFYAYVNGMKNISVYDGGWYEWSSDPENKIEKRS